MHCRWLTFWVIASSPSTRKLTDYFFPRVVKLFVPCRELPLTFEPSLLGCCSRPLGRRASPRRDERPAHSFPKTAFIPPTVPCLDHARSHAVGCQTGKDSFGPRTLATLLRDSGSTATDSPFPGRGHAGAQTCL
ncbi:hypothetical protein Q8A67_023350 [Cirrhinus molitorella]|uniref:Uncharacterized protein n=1 Tax=Cirrhinus molitorella TaxID=172907 RepID=A0AA88P5Y1_9TELE|nr:hypothetical protein Q8A67_023350 [Cirrhinus molitorella]